MKVFAYLIAVIALIVVLLCEVLGYLITKLLLFVILCLAAPFWFVLSKCLDYRNKESFG